VVGRGSVRAGASRLASPHRMNLDTNRCDFDYNSCCHGKIRQRGWIKTLVLRTTPDGGLLISCFQLARQGCVTGRGQPFTYDLFDSLKLSVFVRPGRWFAESSGPPNCCWAYWRNAAIFVVTQPGVIPAHFGINWPNFALGGHCDQMKMILHQDITMHFHPVALCSRSEAR
jgi:hypothetical protein